MFEELVQPLKVSPAGPASRGIQNQLRAVGLFRELPPPGPKEMWEAFYSCGKDATKQATTEVIFQHLVEIDFGTSGRGQWCLYRTLRDLPELRPGTQFTKRWSTELRSNPFGRNETGLNFRPSFSNLEVAELRRTAAREIQRYDQSQAENGRLRDLCRASNEQSIN